MFLSLLISAAMAADPEGGSGFTMMDIWTHSGWIARGVIITLVLMLLAVAFVSVERMIAFGRARRQSMAVAAAVVKPLQAGEVDRALSIAKKEDFKASYLAQVLKAGLGEMNLRVDDSGVKNAERAVDKAIGEEVSKLKRGMTILATVGSTAPFVGLFGTTFGVINAFAGMASGGSGLGAISAGISEALITTAVGIGVAVIGVWAFNYFNSRMDKVKEEMISSEADFMDWAHTLVQASKTPMAGK
jgi:biopolymer transport protein ExbB/biopolymer transport protein TolQ